MEPEIKEGHCEARGDTRAQRSKHRIGLCRNDSWNQELYRIEPELFTTEIRKCPACGVWLCVECWYGHDPAHLEIKEGLKYGVAPSFYATEELCGPPRPEPEEHEDGCFCDKCVPRTGWTYEHEGGCTCFYCCPEAEWNKD